jgi:hypothetical protein
MYPSGGWSASGTNQPATGMPLTAVGVGSFRFQIGTRDAASVMTAEVGWDVRSVDGKPLIVVAPPNGPAFLRLEQ